MSNQRVMCLALGACLLFSVAAHGTQTARAAQSAEYERLPDPKAMAIVPGSPEVFGLAYAAPNDLEASAAALADCEARRAAHDNHCEIRWLNEERVTTGDEVLQLLPEDPHPLYLWRYQQGNTTVYLAGSVHVLKPSLYPLPIQYEQAFDAAETLVLEVNVQALPAAELQRLTLAHIYLPGEQTLQSVLPLSLQQRTARSLSDYGIDMNSLSRIKPSYLMNQLVIARLLALGYLQEYGVEAHFLNQLESRAVLELETVEDQFELLFDQPMAVQIQLLTDALDQEADIEPMMTAMIEAWLSGNDAAFLDIFEAQTGESALGQAFNEQLLDQRNIGMVEKIQQYLRGDGTYFVLIGSAHFIGDNGIIALLKRAGLEGRRITTDTQVGKLH